MTLADLPAVNATLNGLSALLLLAGLACIRRRRVTAHKACMAAAFVVSMLFLASYLVYHAQIGSVRFRGVGAVRTAYLTILVTHTALAVLVPPLAIATLVLGLRARFMRHVRVARWALPIWLYVSVTGVIVYVMLYHLVPTA
jgi:putative membrane protein